MIVSLLVIVILIVMFFAIMERQISAIFQYIQYSSALTLSFSGLGATEKYVPLIFLSLIFVDMIYSIFFVPFWKFDSIIFIICSWNGQRNPIISSPIVFLFLN